MPIVTRLEKLTHTSMPASVYYSLSREAQLAVNAFIDLGGKGWETALEMQDQLWETQRGRSIGHLRWALELAKIDESTLLVWTRKYNTDEKATCQKKPKFSITKILKSILSK